MKTFARFSIEISMVLESAGGCCESIIYFAARHRPRVVFMESIRLSAPDLGVTGCSGGPGRVRVAI